MKTTIRAAALIVAVLAASSCAVVGVPGSDATDFTGAGTQADPRTCTITTGTHHTVTIPSVGTYTKYSGTEASVGVGGMTFQISGQTHYYLPAYPSGAGGQQSPSDCVLVGVPSASAVGTYLIHVHNPGRDVYYKIIVVEPTAWPLVVSVTRAPDGAPVPGVAVTLSHPGTWDSTTLTTGADGLADFGVIIGGNHVLSFVVPPGYIGPSDLTFTHQSGGIRAVQLEVSSVPLTIDPIPPVSAVAGTPVSVPLSIVPVPDAVDFFGAGAGTAWTASYAGGTLTLTGSVPGHYAVIARAAFVAQVATQTFSFTVASKLVPTADPAAGAIVYEG